MRGLPGGRGLVVAVLDRRHRIAVAVLATRHRASAGCRRRDGRRGRRADAPSCPWCATASRRAARRPAAACRRRRAAAARGPAELSHTRVSCRTNGLSVAQRKYSREIRLWTHVLPGIRLVVDVRARLDERVAVHVAADQARAIGQAVREARVRREQQQVRAPAVARRDARRAGRDTPRSRRADPGARPAPPRSPAAPSSSDQPPDERPIVEHDLLALDQLTEGEVRRVAGAGRADVAAGVVHAATAAAVERRRGCAPSAARRTAARSAPPRP